MYVVTALCFDRNRINISVANPKELISLLVILQNSKTVNQFKITEPEVGLVTDLYDQFGWGTFSKFTTKFDWSDTGGE